MTRSAPLTVLHVPVACCAIEALAAESALAELGVNLVIDTPESADVLVVSGTVTHTMAPTIEPRMSPANAAQRLPLESETPISAPAQAPNEPPGPIM